MAGNSNLRKANKNKNDEFYTQLADIEIEMKHYRKHFRNKVVFCNCDDPYESNFFKYFAMNFNFLGLKKLIATCYMGSPVVGQQFEQLSLFDILPNKENTPQKFPYKIEITEVIDANGDGAIDLTDVEYLLRNKKNSLSLLEGDGDFRSEECIEILKQADIIVTNPPFSLFREYIAQLIEYERKFLILGNMNSITYREVFPLLRDNKIWTGYKSFGGGMNMIMPKEIFDKDKIKKYIVDDDGNIIVNIMGVIWFTNLEIPKRHEELELYKKYSPEEYPHYENYNAINVDKVSDIPENYDGEMGVPITFLDKYNPDQFEIIGLGISNSGIEVGVQPYKPEHKKYRKEIQKRGAVDGDLYMMIDNVVTVPYARIIIKKR
ncbi:MAG: adenine-specific methyltransferase EcoRI family protein [Clostridia bacterium]|nr:adenine-specific methyltransferase EcoRI family protein [Clostridia bacterium]